MRELSGVVKEVGTLEGLGDDSADSGTLRWRPCLPQPFVFLHPVLGPEFLFYIQKYTACRPPHLCLSVMLRPRLQSRRLSRAHMRRSCSRMRAKRTFSKSSRMQLVLHSDPSWSWTMTYINNCIILDSDAVSRVFRPQRHYWTALQWTKDQKVRYVCMQFDSLPTSHRRCYGSQVHYTKRQVWETRSESDTSVCLIHLKFGIHFSLHTTIRDDN